MPPGQPATAMAVVATAASGGRLVGALVFLALAVVLARAAQKKVM